MLKLLPIELPARRTKHPLLQIVTCWRDDSHGLKLQYRLPWITRDLLCRSWLFIIYIICRTV